MKVFFIGAGPGDPELITVRGRRLIEECPVCLYAGSLVPREVIASARPGAMVIDTSSLDLDQIIEIIREARGANVDVARVHSGDPSLYGAIAEQIRRLDELGIEWDIVPGVSSFLAAAAELGIELTPAGANQTVILTRAPGRTGVPANENLSELARHRCGLCLFLSAAQMPAVVQSLTPHYGLDAPVAVVYRATWPDQIILRGSIGTIADQMRDTNITLTALVLVGPMLEPDRARNSRLYDPAYAHRFRKRRSAEGQVSRDESPEPERDSADRISQDRAQRGQSLSPSLSAAQPAPFAARPAPPCLIIAGTASGVGKTTVALGLMAALRRRGFVVQPFKVGPDFIDSGHHTTVCDRPSRNLDTWMLDEPTVRELYWRAVNGDDGRAPADIAIIEGVMGLFDGAAAEDERGSTAHLAKLLGVPVVLVADGKAAARSLAATVQGFARFEPAVQVVGVIANRIAGQRHFDYISPGITRHTTVRPLGFLERSEEWTIPERHLGLFTSETAALAGPKLDRLVACVERDMRLDDLLALARPARSTEVQRRCFDVAPASVSTPRRRVRVALARGSGFSFYYEDNLDLMAALGADLIEFDPGHDGELPAGTELIYLGGGYPELYAETLAANTAMHATLRRFVGDGGRVYAECGGLMYLCEALTDLSGRSHALVGLVRARVRMQKRLAALGYVRIRCDIDSLLGPAGTELRGHEFHYSTLEPSGALARVTSRCRDGEVPQPDGVRIGRGVAGYAHLHFASNPPALRRMLMSSKD